MNLANVTLDDPDLTLSVLNSLMERNRSSIMIYHSLEPALCATGDAALRTIAAKMDPDTLQEDDLIAVSSLLSNLSPGSVSRELALSIARDLRLPAQARIRAYSLAGSPLEEDGISLALLALHHDDWDRHYEAGCLVKIHPDPTHFLVQLLRDCSIPLKRRKKLAAEVARVIPDAEPRRAFSRACVADPSFHEELTLTLQLFEARFGERTVFEHLVEGIGRNPIENVATTIALFGHFPDQALADRAAVLARNRVLSADEVVRIANSVVTGMLHIFEMDFGFGGIVHPAPPHPGLPAWVELLEDWAERRDLSPLGRFNVLTEAAELGSERARAQLEAEILSINDLDGVEWAEDDKDDLTLSRALRQVQRRKPLLPSALIDKIVASTRYNVAARGIEALQALGNAEALQRLINLHDSKSDWSIKDTIANAIELMAARQGVVIQKVGRRYAIIMS